MTVLIIVVIALAALFGWLLLELARTSGSERLPRALAGALAQPLAIRSAMIRRRESAQRTEPDVPDEGEVELAIRERLYGSSSRPR